MNFPHQYDDTKFNRDSKDERESLFANTSSKDVPQFAFLGVIGLIQKYKTSNREIIQVFKEYLKDFESILDYRTGICEVEEYNNKIDLDEQLAKKYSQVSQSGGKILYLKDAVEMKLEFDFLLFLGLRSGSKSFFGPTNVYKKFWF